jgi:hypothetical protein
MEEQVSEYWQDLAAAIGSAESEYFLGTIVATPDDRTERLTVIDGQQRLATTTMLLAAIRNALAAGGEESRADTVERDYIAKHDLTADQLQPQLYLNSEDNHYFTQRVINRPGGPAPKAMHQSHLRINTAQGLADRYVQDLIAASGQDWPRALVRWVTFLEKQVRVILVTVPNETDAFLIFETLNDRGLDLTIADLLKNYLFSQSGERLEEVKQAWLSAIATLEISAENELFVTFLRHYWSSKYGLVRERDLYKSFKQQIRSEAQAVEFAENLHDAARLYAALLNSDNDYWARMGAETRANIQTLLRLGLEQNRTLLLATMQHFTPAELKKVLRAVVAWSVRGLVVGGFIGGGTIEKALPTAAVKIRSGAIKDASSLGQELNNVIPSDGDFEEAFRRVRVNSSKLARYYLLSLEKELTGQPEPELVPNADEEQVNLEHVLPRNAKAGDWPLFPPQDIPQWVPRLGNLVLLAKGVNNRLGNKPFADKKPVLSASQLLGTQSAGQEADWTPEAIQRRQDSLARLAPSVWPRQV